MYSKNRTVKFITVFFTVVAVFFAQFGIAGAVAEPQIDASTAILVDLDTGQVLYSKDPTTERPMASVTKMMTALLAAEYDPELDDIITVTAHDIVGGTTANLIPGVVMSMNNMIYGMMVPSGNDASMAIADHIGRTYLGGADPQTGVALFVDLMNTKAQQMGMTGTNFVHPHGLDNANHYSTAADLAILGKAYVENPLFADIRMTSTIRVTSTVNDLPRIHNWRGDGAGLCYPGAIGGKTGTTVQAGQVLVWGSQRGNTRLLSVVMNSPDRYEETYNLHDYGYQVLGETASATGSCQETSSKITYNVASGAWVQSNWFAAYEEGYSRLSTTTGNSAVFSFRGDGVSFVSYKSNSRGKADIYLDGVFMETVDLYSSTAQPFSTIYSTDGLSYGNHTLEVRLMGQKNENSSNYTIDIDAFRTQGAVPDALPPSVSISAPANSSTVSGSVTIETSATDNDEVGAVSFWYDETNLIGEDASSPFSAVWDTTPLPDGNYSLIAVARDVQGNVATSSPISVTISNTVPPDPTPPPQPTQTSPSSFSGSSAQRRQANLDSLMAANLISPGSPSSTVGTIPGGGVPSYILQAQILDLLRQVQELILKLQQRL